MILNLFFYSIIFLFGLATGSFLNCIIYRLHSGENFLFTPLEISAKAKKPGGFFKRFLTGFTRSYCPHCKHILGWQDLIPVLSFLILKGKCRYCQKRISFQYPLVELATGILFVFIFQQSMVLWLSGSMAPWFFNTFFLFLISCFLIIIFVYDLKHFIIPDKIIYPAILMSGIWYLVLSIFFNFYTRYEILNTIYAALGAAAFFLIIVLISQGKWMGIGDIKLAFFMGLFLGFPNILVALFLAFFIGAIIGVGLIAAGKKTIKSEVPFGPFLVTGTFIALFWGQQLTNCYQNLFLI